MCSMMMSEFVERTGFEPMPDEYEKIEEGYYHFDGSKDDFCKSWLAGGGILKAAQARAEKISQLRSELLELDRANRMETDDYERRIEQLKAQLDRELEWELCADAGTRMSQRAYEDLAGAGTAMTDEEAKAFIANECGFDPEKVVILHEVSTYEVNKYRQLRPAARFTRQPIYNATDWNYIRFDCACFMYELVNGELHFYSC